MKMTSTDKKVFFSILGACIGIGTIFAVIENVPVEKETTNRVKSMTSDLQEVDVVWDVKYYTTISDENTKQNSVNDATTILTHESISKYKKDQIIEAFEAYPPYNVKNSTYTNDSPYENEYMRLLENVENTLEGNGIVLISLKIDYLVKDGQVIDSVDAMREWS